MLEIRNLELHVTHACNLACESCSHYSNQHHAGNLDLAEAERWMRAWAPRVQPRTFSLLGGEPSIHPRLAEFIPLTRRHFHDSILRLVTNGFFLHRHPDLPWALRDDPHAELHLSVHHASAEYMERLEPVLDLVEGWVNEHRIRLVLYVSHRHWTRRYRGFGAEMRPFEDGLPRQSWDACPAKYCTQLHDGRIWKCPPLTYLPMQAAKYALSPAWQPYLHYRPLDADCSETELAAFFAREDERFCGMCPAHPEPMDLPNPLRAPNLPHDSE